LSSCDITLEARDLECIRGERLLFRNLDVHLLPGTLLHVEGANGAGKSTLLRVLAGLSLPETGTVYWCGKPIPQYRWEFAESLSYIGHRAGLKGELNPVENLDLTCRLRGNGALHPQDALLHMDLATCLDLPCRMLSAGQQRRVALARLLINPSPIWILDEPYTALDQKGIGIMNRLLTEHLNAGGIGIVSSHQVIGAAGTKVVRIRLGHD
jgi:heme exporter protein A